MPGPITHFLVMQEACPPEIWQMHRKFAGSATFGPDLFYTKGLPLHFRGLTRMLGSKDKDYAKASDIMHWEGSLDYYCCMLDYIKTSIGTEDKEKIDRLKAYAYGYYSHVVTDAVFHPFIYRHTRDHWERHFTPEDFTQTYNSHKGEETLTDAFLAGRMGTNPYALRYQDKVDCGRTLDGAIFSLLHHSLGKIYGGGIFDSYGIDYQKFFGQDPRDPHHPIRDAHRDYIDSFKELYRIGRVIPQWLHPLVPVKNLNVEQLREIDPYPRKKWYGNHEIMPDYSVPELFEFAIKATKMVINASERFFSSDAKSSREFFSQHAQDVVFLEDNYNFDIGYLSRENAAIKGMRQSELFNHRLDWLGKNYRTIDAYVL